MKNFFLLFVAIFTFFIQLNAQQTYTVVVPEGTNACFIAGEMNNWSQIEMNQVSAQTFSLTIDNATPTHLYKYCSGPNWSFVEKDSLGNDVQNRSYHEKDTVANWAAVWIPSSTSVIYTVNVPENTNACYIAGDMNSWSQLKMDRVNNKTYSITIKNATTDQTYKYCSGPNWSYVEKTKTGGDVANRAYHEKDTVAAWAAVWESDENNGPIVPSGKIKRFFFESKYVASRNVDIWLPDGYSKNKKYAVLYMQDGQNLFDGPSNTLNGAEWKADETATSLIAQHKIKDLIIVGPWNSSSRYSEFFPEKAFAYMPETISQPKINEMSGNPLSDEYLKFIVEELKPFIDSTFSTYTDQPNTFVGGSSFGGLISMYAICEYPDVFGGACCMSTHWANNSLDSPYIPDGLRKYMIDHLPSPTNHKFYFDRGTVGLDANYPTHQEKVDTIMNFLGYDSTNWITRVYPGHDHNEYWWSKRFDVPLRYLLGKEPFFVTSNQSLSVPGYTLFPNPSTNFLIIRGWDKTKSHFVSVFNLTGSAQQIDIDKETGKIDLTNLQYGIYFLKIDEQILKFIKQ